MSPTCRAGPLSVACLASNPKTVARLWCQRTPGLHLKAEGCHWGGGGWDRGSEGGPQQGRGPVRRPGFHFCFCFLMSDYFQM